MATENEKKKPVCPFCDKLVVYGTKHVKCSNPHCKFSHGGCNRKAFDAGVVSMFIQFYKIYPNKQKPKDALIAWIKLSPDKVLYQKIMKHVVTAKEHSKSWNDGYIPHPTTYINGFRWEDTIDRQKDFSFNRTQQSNNKPVAKKEVTPEAVAMRKQLMALGKVLASGTQQEKEEARAELTELQEKGDNSSGDKPRDS
jgi:hypothetical protein